MKEDTEDKARPCGPIVQSHLYHGQCAANTFDRVQFPWFPRGVGVELSGDMGCLQVGRKSSVSHSREHGQGTLEQNGMCNVWIRDRVHRVVSEVSARVQSMFYSFCRA